MLTQGGTPQFGLKMEAIHMDRDWSTKMGKAIASMTEEIEQEAANVQAYQAKASRKRDAARREDLEKSHKQRRR